MSGDRGWRWGVTACAAAAVLTGCAHEPEPAADPPATSPLAEILGWGMAVDHSRGPTEVTEVERQRQLRVEELIADCMAEAGFEYVPLPLEQRRAGPFDEAYALEPADFAARYGYGATTLGTPDDHPVTDPNQRIVESLPQQEQLAYRVALWGDAVTGTPPPSGSDTPGNQGCQHWANDEVYGLDGAGGISEGHVRFAELFEHLNQLWERIESDPRLAGSERDWVACMQEAGYPDFHRPHDAQQSVFDRLAELAAEGEPDPAAVANLQDYELALAPIDQACREAHIERPRRTVAYELEAAFVAEHREELEAYRDWMTGVRPGD